MYWIEETSKKALFTPLFSFILFFTILAVEISVCHYSGIRALGQDLQTFQVLSYGTKSIRKKVIAKYKEEEVE